MPPAKTPLPMRAIVVALRLYKGMTPRKTAEFMGVSVQMIHKHESRVKEEIERWIQERELQD